MKHKTFLTALLLFLLTINLGVALISICTYREAVEQEKRHAASEHYFIASGLIKDIAALDSRSADYRQGIIQLVQPYGYLAGGQNAGIALCNADEILYANIRGMDVLDISTASHSEERQIVLMGKGADAAVIVSGSFPEPYNNYALIYRGSISEAIQGWQSMRNTMFCIGLILSGVLSICLLLLFNKLFRPLTDIAQISRRIAGGEHSTRLEVRGTDELGEMAESFNYMADELERQMGELVVAAENKQSFIDNFAHELKTPLTAIHGYAEYLQKAALSEEDWRFATDCILSESSRIQTMAYQLMELANLRRDQIHMEDISPGELLLRVKRAMLPKASQQNTDLQFYCELLQLHGDIDLLESLLINLIDNAIKASEAGASVIVRAFTDANIPMITIEDRGKGIPTEALPHLTEPYYRVEKHRRRQDGGAGLGLAICNQIVAQHNAELMFNSSPGEGTTVKIYFYNSTTT